MQKAVPEPDQRSAAATEADAMFVRQSSGLVRSLGLRDAFLTNLGLTGAFFSISLAFMISQALWAYPEADFTLAAILSVVVSLPVALAYGLLSVAMPRAGGDYVFISRTLHPLLGFLANWGIMVMLSFFIGWAAYWGGAQTLSIVLATLGNTLDAVWLIDASTWIAGKAGSFIVGLAVILCFAAAAIAGARVVTRVILGLVGLGVIGTIVGLIVMAAVGSGSFADSFNDFMTRFTDRQNYYDTVINRASDVPLDGFSLGATFAILPIVAFSSLFIFASSYIGGEVKSARRTQLLSMPLALIVLSIANIVIFLLVQKLVGSEFLTAVNVDFYNGTLTELPIPPYFNLFATVATGNVILSILIGMGFLTLSLISIPVDIMICTRMMFAWSFDRVLPAKIAEVDDRFQSPIYAVVLVTLLGIAFLAIYVFTTWLTTLGAILGMLPAIFLACVAAAILPWRKPALMKSAGIDSLRVGGIPLITVMGVLGAIYAATIFVVFLTNDLYLVNSAAGLRWIGGVFVVGLLVFAVSWAVRRSRGGDLLRAYREVPPA